jgi:hypothetical protein
MDARLALLADQSLLRAGDDRLTAGGLVADSRRSTTADIHRLRAGRDDRDGAVGTPGGGRLQIGRCRRRPRASLRSGLTGLPAVAPSRGRGEVPGPAGSSADLAGSRPLATRWRPCPHLLRRRHRGHSPTEAWLTRGQEHDKRVRRASLAETSCESARVRAMRCRPVRSVV